MGTRRVTRYYAPHSVDLNGIHAIRKVLSGTFSDQDQRRYRLVYPSCEIEVSHIDDVASVFGSHGPTDLHLTTAKSSGGRYGTVDCTNRSYIKVEYYSGQIDADQQVNKFAEALGLRPLNRIIRSAFVAHGFTDEGKRYAREVRSFLELLGIAVATGEYFEPRSVSDKVRSRIAATDAFVAIVTPQDDHTWIIQETTFADSLGKQPIVLVEQTVEHKRGLRGDNEDIFFPTGHVSETFTPILQGLHVIRGTSGSF